MGGRRGGASHRRGHRLSAHTDAVLLLQAAGLLEKRPVLVSHLIELSGEDVAKACGITPIHLSRLFNRFSGMGAYRFLLRLRMNRAAGMLMNEGMLVKDVATTLGYGDPFRFSRAFKRVYGIPPNRVILPRMVNR
jgi:transcriptional regulator GlxA family with amidase domain